MNAKQLQIGNLLGYLEVDLDSGSEIVKNYPCTLNDIAEIERGNVCGRYSEVTITNELLEKFGFEEEDRMYGWKLKCGEYTIEVKINAFSGTLNHDPKWVVSILTGYGSQPVTVIKKYIHELRNLYSALSNEELQIK